MQQTNLTRTKPYHFLEWHTNSCNNVASFGLDKPRGDLSPKLGKDQVVKQVSIVRHEPHCQSPKAIILEECVKGNS